MKSSPITCLQCPSLNKGIFCSLSDPELMDLSSHKVTNIYKKGQTLFVQGNPAFGFYCISKGNIKLSKVGPNGEESIIKIATAGEVVGHKALFCEGPYTATATALEDTEVCFLDKKYIVKLLQEKPTVAMNLITRLSMEMMKTENKMASLHQKNVRERLAELLLLLKESHGVEQKEGKILINLELTREEMASMIGTANETLIRFISEFKDEGLIAQQKRNIIILDQQKLQQWAG